MIPTTETLYVSWSDPKTNTDYVIGKLVRNKQDYTFEYCGDYKKAFSAGCSLSNAFPDFTKKYTSPKLFVAFACRLPDPKRRNIDQVLAKYGMKEYDGFELLKRSSGKLPIDRYSFSCSRPK